MFLEIGTEDDRYDFLDLYLRRWQQEHNATLDTCRLGGNRRRARNAEVDSADRFLSETQSTPQQLDLPHYRGEFNPYDW